MKDSLRNFLTGLKIFVFFTFFVFQTRRMTDSAPKRRKNLVSRRDVVTVDEDRDPERRGDKEEIGTACTRSRKMINETGRTMESGRKVGLHVSFYFSPSEFSNRSTRYRRTDAALTHERTADRFVNAADCFFCRVKGIASSFFNRAEFFHRLSRFSVLFLFRAVKSKLIDSWWTLILRVSLIYLV